jgi:AraC family transcriptional regulator of adaptative response / DNA-3-methyladenine glycosylase II
VAPGYHWDAVRSFLAARAIPGAEAVDGDTYRRTITMAGAPGLLEVSPRGAADPAGGSLLLRAHLPYWEGLIHLVDRVSRVLGTDADHAVDAAALPADPVPGLATAHLGPVIPGAWNPFEAGVWAILPGRERLLEAFVAHLGIPVPGLPGGLTHTFPDSAAVTQAALAPAGLPEAEATAIAALAGALAAGKPVSMDPDQWRPWLALAAAHLMAHPDPLGNMTAHA